MHHLLNCRTTPKSTKVKSEKSKSSGTKKSGKKKDGKGEDDTDSEEERWLDAIESGKLEEVKSGFNFIHYPFFIGSGSNMLGSSLKVLYRVIHCIF